MVTKKRLGSERVQPDSGHYLAIEPACQGAFASHPKGMALPAHDFVEALDRRFPYALRTSPRPASCRSMSRLSLVAGLDPSAVKLRWRNELHSLCRVHWRQTGR